MKLSGTSFSRVLFPMLFLAYLLPAFGQVEVEPRIEANYDAVLHVVAGNYDSDRTESLPSSLSSLSKQIRRDFGVTNVKLLNTYLGRISNNGRLVYKGISNAYDSTVESGAAPAFVDWSLDGMKSLSDGGQNIFQFRSFRFSARIPIRVANFHEEAGKSTGPINYDTIALSLDPMSVEENEATLLGTLSEPGANGSLFLILTLKSSGK